jgi:hypothetical protein
MTDEHVQLAAAKRAITATTAGIAGHDIGGRNPESIDVLERSSA